MPRYAAHEAVSPHSAVEAGSDRAFGIVFVVVFAGIGAWPLLGGEPPRTWLLALAALLGLATAVAPHLLAPFNRLWFRFGLALQKVVTPVVLGVLFFAVITPMALLMRATGRDPLALARDRDAKSYWIARDPPGPPPGSLENQF